MQTKELNNLFTKEVLDKLLPPQLSDDFFEALYGDVEEGAYDISLSYNNYEPEKNILSFDLKLHERPEKCLSCNLTFGLPQVFSKHPILNIDGMVKKIDALLGDEAKCSGWQLGNTGTPSSTMHIIPLIIQLG